MGARITEKLIKSLEKPATRSRITYDSELKGFGVCLTKAGKASFVLNYSIHGRERRMTIGHYPAWSVAKAREQASKLRFAIDNGHDPLEERETKRTAWTVRDLYAQYSAHRLPTLAERSQVDVKAMWEVHIIPFCGAKKLQDLRAKDIDDLHKRISKKTPIRANCVLEVFRHSLNLAMRWGEIERNPANGFKRNRAASEAC